MLHSTQRCHIVRVRCHRVRTRHYIAHTRYHMVHRRNYRGHVSHYIVHIRDYIIHARCYIVRYICTYIIYLVVPENDDNVFQPHPGNTFPQSQIKRFPIVSYRFILDSGPLDGMSLETLTNVISHIVRLCFTSCDDFGVGGTNVVDRFHTMSC